MAWPPSRTPEHGPLERGAARLAPQPLERQRNNR